MHNEHYKNGVEFYSMSINQFSDGTNPFLGAKAIIPVIEEIEIYLANDDEWEKYKSKHEKVYSKEEEPLKY